MWRTGLAGLIFTAAACAQQRPVLLVSIDGLRPDYVLEADAHGLKIPNLRRMVAEGTYSTGVHGVLPTVTYPSHTTLVTGVSPARHGICANNTFDPEGKNQSGWYWYASDIKVPTLWDAASKAGRITANVHWPVTVGARIDFNLPQYWRAGTADDRKLLRELATPGLIDALERELPPYADGQDESLAGDQRRAQYAVKLLQLKRPGFMTVYLTSLDHEEHQSGPFSPAANATLEKIDELIGTLRETAGPQMVFAVVSDHGFLPTSKDVNLLIKVREEGLIAFEENGRVKSWAVTGWPSGASAAVMIHPDAPAGAKQKIGELLERLAKDPASGVARILSADDVERLGGCKQGVMFIELKPGFTLGPRITGALVTDSTTRGMHGFLPDRKEMNATFLIAGPGIERGKSIGEIDMRDIAPSLAKMLGVNLPDAEGHNVLPR